MSQPALPPHGTQSISVPALSAVPLGPDEPELFADAMERILKHLGSDPPSRGTS
jgi:hypothetical protein